MSRGCQINLSDKIGPMDVSHNSESAASVTFETDTTAISSMALFRIAGGRSIGRAMCARRGRRTMAQGPDVGRHRRHLIGGQLSATHGRHGRAILFRLRHTGVDYFCNRSVTAVAPQPMSAGEIGT